MPTVRLIISFFPYKTPPKLASTLSLKPTFTRCASKLPGYHNTYVVIAQIGVVVLDAVVEYGHAHTIAIVAHGVGG